MVVATVAECLHQYVYQVVPLAPDHAGQMHPLPMPSSAAILMLTHFAAAEVLVYAKKLMIASVEVGVPRSC